jgi:hypothetical protein
MSAVLSALTAIVKLDHEDTYAVDVAACAGQKAPKMTIAMVTATDAAILLPHPPQAVHVPLFFISTPPVRLFESPRRILVRNFCRL